MSETVDLNTEAGCERARSLGLPVGPLRVTKEVVWLDGETQVIEPHGSRLGRHCLHLPGHTTRLNALMSGVRQKIRLRSRDNLLVSLAAKKTCIPFATGPRRVSLLVVLAPGQRAGDRDNWFKSLLDALVRVGFLVDDGAAHCELGPVEFARGPRAAMYVTLEDLPR